MQTESIVSTVIPHLIVKHTAPRTPSRSAKDVTETRAAELARLLIAPNLTDAFELIAGRGVSGGNGAIVLLHAGPDLTPHILPAIIAGYRARGFGFVTVPDLLAQ